MFNPLLVFGVNGTNGADDGIEASPPSQWEEGSDASWPIRGSDTAWAWSEVDIVIITIHGSAGPLLHITPALDQSIEEYQTSDSTSAHICSV